MVDFGSLEPGWAEFFCRIDKEVLGVLSTGEEELSEFASRRGELPDLLIDTLNDIAIDTIGDIIVENDALIDEYKAIIATHLRKV